MVSEIVMVSLNLRSAMTGIALIAGFAVIPAPADAASDTHLFASEANARDICGQDKVVWAYLDKPEYFRQGAADYAKGKGAYTCEKSVRSRGWHVATGQGGTNAAPRPDASPPR